MSLSVIRRLTILWSLPCYMPSDATVESMVLDDMKKKKVLFV